MNILVLCTGNSARSILLESILSHCSDGRICAYSAGSKPAGRVNPAALAQLAAVGLPDSGYRSKTWDEFATLDAPVMDLVVTVCGNARDETCPVWLGAPLSAHWGVDDPRCDCPTRCGSRGVFRDLHAVAKVRRCFYGGTYRRHGS